MLRPPPKPIRVAIFVSGRGSNMAALFDAKAAGRLPLVEFALAFSDFESPPAFERARAEGVPALGMSPRAFASKQAFEEAAVEALRGFGVEWILLAGYMRIVGPTLLGAFPNRILNIHPSLLPAFPGLHAQRQAVEYGVRVSGCTVHFVDGGMDTGPIILQRVVPCPPGDDEASLAARILEQEHKIYAEALEIISSGRARLEGRRVFIEPEPAE